MPAPLLEAIRELTTDEAQQIISSLTDDEAESLLYDWKTWARPEQLLPDSGDWTKFLIKAGRGFGKTRAGSEAVRQVVEEEKAQRIALVGATAADVRDVMIEGEAGILSVFPPSRRPEYESSKRRVTFATGAIASCYSAEEPNRLRGPAHDFAWCDELAAWKKQETFDNLMLGLRLGSNPRVVITTTPRPIPIIKELLDSPDCVVTSGSTYDNIANLAPTFISHILRRYENTRLGRQELLAEILDDVPGALWTRANIEENRISGDVPDMVRIVVAVDPEATSGTDSAETGIIVCGVDKQLRGFVIDDVSIKGSPHVWASQVVASFHKHKADRIVAESNQGGEMVAHTIATVDRKVPVKLIHASRSKQTRAEPVAALYEQGKVSHIGMFGELEDQMCTWVPGEKSPDRLDALVHGFSELMLGRRAMRKMQPVSTLTRESLWTR